MKDYLEYNNKNDAQVVLDAENAKWGFPLPGCVTTNAFEILKNKHNKHLIPFEYVTVPYDNTKGTKKTKDLKDEIDVTVQ